MLKNQHCLDPTTANLFYPPIRHDYVYFEGPRYTSGKSLFADAAWAADAAMFAYARYSSARIAEGEYMDILHAAGFPIAEPIGDCFVENARAARGFFAANDDFGMLAFRGTEKGNNNDMEADIDVVLIEDNGVKVERGFYNYLQAQWPKVVNAVKKYRQTHPTQDICITGHSLGAAMASIAFTDLHDPATSLYTFGCPRVGDKTFCDRIMAAARTQRCYRVVDNQDFVTHVPLPNDALPYLHPAITLLWIDATHDHKVVKNPPEQPGDWMDVQYLAPSLLHSHWYNHMLPQWKTQLPVPLADHSPVRYCHWIAQAG